VLVDFGLATQFTSEVSREAMTGVGFAAGTFSGMAPEQIRGELIDARADLYSLGCMLYELVTGRPPFVAELPVEVLWQHLNADPEPPSTLVKEIPEALDSVILRLLAKKPRERFGHAGDVAAALTVCIPEEPPNLQSAPVEAGPKPRAYLYRPGFVGRDDALTELEGQLERLEKGQGGLVFIGGESGIGKTRLMLELARGVRARQLRILSGAGLTLDAGSSAAPTSGPLQAMRRALTAIADYVRERGSKETARLLGRRGKVLAIYEPALRGLPGLEAFPEPAELPGEAARTRLYSDLLETLQAVSEEQSLVLILDDLQWADELTLGFLGFLTRAAARRAREVARLLVLGTYRTEELNESLQTLLELPGIRRLRLRRLEEQAVGGMVCDMLALPQAPPALTRYLSRHSEGNPFFVAEYLRTAVREGLLSRDETGRWQVTNQGEDKGSEDVYERLPLPQSVQELVARRLARLGDSAARLVDAAAVLGKESDASLLARVSRLQPVDVLEATLELLGQQVMEDVGGGSLRFVHDKLREVALRQLPDSRRVELHRAAAEALQALESARQDERQAELGHHWERAGQPAEARACYLVAAHSARERFAYAEAERLYRAYFSLLEVPTPVSIEARNEFGMNVLGIQGKMDLAEIEHETALDESRRIGHRYSEASSLRMLGHLSRNRGRLDRARRFFESALTIAREIGDRFLEARVLDKLSVCCADQGLAQEGRSLIHQSLAIYRETGNRRVEGEALGNLAVVAHFQGSVAEALDLYEQALAIHQEIGDRRAEGNTLSNLALLYAYQGRWAEALDRNEQAIAIHREVGHRRSEAITLTNQANLLRELGNTERASALYDEALAINRQIADPRSEASTLCRLGDLCREQGRIAEARAQQERGLMLLRQVGDPRNEGVTLAQMGTLERQAGNDLAKAERLTEAAEGMLRTAQASFELALTLCSRGHVELAQARSSQRFLAEAACLYETLGARPESEIGVAMVRLRRAQEAFDAGQQARLFHGELIEDLPDGLRRWLQQEGQLQG
jgi:predicted ATPase